MHIASCNNARLVLPGNVTNRSNKSKRATNFRKYHSHFEHIIPDIPASSRN